MNLTLVFSRKYRWPERYFSVWCLGSSQKLLTTNQFLVSTIFFTIMNISFFNLCFDLFSNQKQYSCSSCCSSPCVSILLCTHYGSLQCFSTYFRKLKESEFYGPYFQTWLSRDQTFLIFYQKIQLLVIFFIIKWCSLINTCSSLRP